MALSISAQFFSKYGYITFLFCKILLLTEDITFLDNSIYQTKLHNKFQLVNVLKNFDNTLRFKESFIKKKKKNQSISK